MVTLVLRDDSYVDVTLERTSPLFWFHYKQSTIHLGGGGGSAITGTTTLTGTSTTSGPWTSLSTTGNLTITKFF